MTLASLVWLVPFKGVGSGRWVLLGTVAVVTLASWAAIRLFVRRLPRVSPKATVGVLSAYAAMPIAVPLLQVAVDDTVTPPGGKGAGFLGFVVFFAAVFVTTATATAYGVGALMRRAVRHAVHDLRNSAHLMGRALPPMLFVTLFIFFTGELWQAMNRLSWLRLALIVVLFVGVTVLAAAARLRDEIGRVEQDLSPPLLSRACRRTPLASVDIDGLTPGAALDPVSLNKRQVRNLLLLFALRQLVQAAVFGLGLFLFFLVLGLIVVTPETAEQWIGSPPVYSVLLPDAPLALLRNATLIAAFGSMYFAITSMTDADHRREFFAPIIDEVERILAVHAVYLALGSRQNADETGAAADG
ncbi:hypothetical protein [Streptomyces neyagawaensis]|uniref:hypothetical protein n=1 Tax=Streptomyces neyagawaensis TaxID=42238 RepID=UPI0012FE940F|nr:hypothetical protein [Streptomyces neyagawaensis]MCL6731604.1 hypothetical protein [Streptomyces neyagawaensis]MDE1683160.1 hypothetical protein [Streptomyces neyagawaensis]